MPNKINGYLNKIKNFFKDNQYHYLYVVLIFITLILCSMVSILDSIIFTFTITDLIFFYEKYNINKDRSNEVMSNNKKVIKNKDKQLNTSKSEKEKKVNKKTKEQKKELRKKIIQNKN